MSTGRHMSSRRLFSRKSCASARSTSARSCEHAAIVLRASSCSLANASRCAANARCLSRRGSPLAALSYGARVVETPAQVGSEPGNPVVEQLEMVRVLGRARGLHGNAPLGSPALGRSGGHGGPVRRPGEPRPRCLTGPRPRIAYGSFWRIDRSILNCGDSFGFCTLDLVCGTRQTALTAASARSDGDPSNGPGRGQRAKPTGPVKRPRGTAERPSRSRQKARGATATLSDGTPGLGLPTAHFGESIDPS